MNEEHRKRTRVATGHAAILAVGDLEIPVQTVNLSLKGALTSPAESLSRGQLCLFSVLLSENLRIEAEGRVVRSDEDGLALEFTRIDDESFPHLLRLIELHYGDADAIERELSTPAFEP